MRLKKELVEKFFVICHTLELMFLMTLVMNNWKLELGYFILLLTLFYK